MKHLVIKFGCLIKRSEPMKLFLFILLFYSSSYSQSQEKIPPSIQEKINKGMDHYNVSLYEDSKKIFLDLLYSDEGKKYEAEIRYHLGLASYYQGNTQDAAIQWKILIKKYPSNNRSTELRRTSNTWDRMSDEKESIKEVEREFAQEKQFGYNFWDYSRAESKLLFGELKDPVVAVKYYEKLYKKYDDPEKKFVIALQLFALYGGFNQNKYGYKNQDSYGKSTGSDDPYKSFSNAMLANKAQGMLREMEKNISGEFDINYYHFIRWNYLWAVRLSDAEFFSEKVKANNQSEVFFGKVVSLTDSRPNEIYRLFSIMWLGDAANKYVISDDLLEKYKPYGLTNKDLLLFNNSDYPEDLWVELAQRNFNHSLVVDSHAFIRAIRLEKLLKQNNLINTYNFQDLENDIKNIDGWSQLFTSPNFPDINSELGKWVMQQFDCQDVKCLTDTINVIKGNISIEINQQSKRRSSKIVTRDTMFLNFLSISVVMVLGKNKVNPKDFVGLYLKEKNILYPK